MSIYSKHKQILHGRLPAVMMFMLSLLMLGIPCPVKRLLLDSPISASAGSSRSIKAIIQFNAAGETTTITCNGNADETILSAVAKLSVPLINLSLPVQIQGDQNYKYLNGKDQKYRFSNLTQASSLPLFLEQQRWLI